MGAGIRVAFVLALCFLAVCVATEPIYSVAQLQNGAIRGKSMILDSGRQISAFLGIPYARPPVGKHRFKEPKPAKPWYGVWEATKPPPYCLQFERVPTNKVQGDEDCLYVNVYTPKLPTAGNVRPMDVAVFIHGGGFMYGGSRDWLPDILLSENDVVFVTFNYRLGPLGFLSTEDDVVPGNMGLKDQALALRWIKDNIAAFGGNPNSISIFGLSAGGASVHYQFLSPTTVGLFHRGWALSGSALSSWPQQKAASLRAKRLADLLGCPTNSSINMIDCLRTRPARSIVERVPDSQDWLQNPFTTFGPVVEPATSHLPFLTKAPIDVIRAGEAHDLPFVTGVTSEEGLYNAAEIVLKDDILEKIDQDWLRVAPLMLDYNFTAQDKDVVSKAVRDKYFGNARINRKTAKQLIEMIGDRAFKVGVEQAAREMSAANTQPVYFYNFEYRGQNSLSTFMSGGDRTDFGVSHGDDVAYAIKWSAIDTDQIPKDVAMRKQYVQIWRSFMQTGVPAGLPGSPAWTPMSSEGDITMMNFNKDGSLALVSEPQIGNRDFWLSLPLNENIPQTSAPGHEEL